MIRRKLYFMWAITAAVVLAATSASADVVFNNRDAFATEIINDCTGETLLFEGIFHIVVREKFADDGSSVVVERINAHGNGIGLTSGAEYVWNDTFQTTLEDIPDVSFTVNQSFYLRLIGKGEAENALLRGELFLRFNADGSVDVDMSNTTTCPGN